MSVVIRYARPDEFAAVAELDGASFGFHYSDQELAEAHLDIDADRVLIAANGDQVIGISAEVPFAMALPGGRDAPVTGLTWVSVEVTHRRRGVLRALVDHQLRAQAHAGAFAAVLAASEGGIYGRYGFGVATHSPHLVLDRVRARLRTPVDASAVRRLTTSAARELLPDLHERWRALTPGALRRDEKRWEFTLLDRDYQRGGKSGLFHLVHPDGYVSYRIKTQWNEGDPRHECWLVDYAPITEQAHAALWQTVLSMDLVGSIHSFLVPTDDPLALLLEDYRRAETTHLGDGLWVRPLDVAQLLGTRSYGVDVRAAIGVSDSLLGDGVYALDGGPDGATCVRASGEPDLRIDVAALGAAILGGVRLRRLARAGYVECADAHLLDRMDRALLADRLPSYGTAF